MGQVERRIRVEARADAVADLDDPAAFSESDIGKKVLVNGELTKNLYGGRSGFEKDNRAWMRKNGGAFVKIIELVGWRKDVAKCEDIRGEIGYLRKTHILYMD